MDAARIVIPVPSATGVQVSVEAVKYLNIQLHVTINPYQLISLPYFNHYYILTHFFSFPG